MELLKPDQNSCLLIYHGTISDQLIVKVIAHCSAMILESWCSLFNAQKVNTVLVFTVLMSVCVGHIHS